MADKVEKTIGEQALAFLGGYYAKHEKKSGLLINQQVGTHQGTFADVLLAYQKHDNTFFTASLDVSGSERIAHLLRTYKKNGLGNGRYLSAIVLFACAAAWCYLLGMWVTLALLPLTLALAGFVAHTQLRRRCLRRQLHIAVDRLKQQPADHQWLGVQVSSLNWRGNAMAAYLSKLCERKGVGLLTMGKRARLTLHQEPRPATCRRHDFLAYYLHGDSLRKELGDQFMRVA